MKKILLILLCLPFIGFGQVKNNKSTFNFNNTNNYTAEYSKPISKKYYNSPTKYNFNKSSKEDNDSTSSYIFYSQNKTSYSPFNKGLIHLLSKAMQKGIENKESILKTQNKQNKTQTK
mgnify:CR=1 FL=1